MTVGEAADLIGPARRSGTRRERWADLGCGDGTFTVALATLLPAGSVIHAVDRDAAALGAIPRQHGGVAIATHAADFTRLPWPFDAPDGVMLANALHYVAGQPAFVRRAAAAMTRPRFIVVEYDTDARNPWIPYPLSRGSLTRLFTDAGFDTVRPLGTRRSRYRREPIYAVEISSTRTSG
jgi:trans-aconitate methyltransferase